MLRVLFAAALLIAPAAATAQPSIATNSPVPLSTRVVDYNIDAKVDVSRKTLDATESLTYRNLTGQPLTSFPFHLYLNAFQPDSTFTSETHFSGGIRDSESEDTYPDRKRGSIVISHLEADGFGDLTPALHFASPDDNNPADRTVAVVDLAHPLAPGDSITFHIRFHDQFPESVARNGYKRDFLMGGQWFPKLGVFWHGAWNCHQYHATTEFFSDFGTFHVALTLPRNYIVGASGVPNSDHLNPDGTRTRSFYAEDVHDFAWAASPHFTLTTDTFASSLGPVQVRVLALAAHPRAGPRYLSILLGAMRQFEDRFGPYPYKVLTLIDPEPDSEMEGMEYPTLITGGTAWFEPTYLTELTAEHEFGHQYWYGMVATNEFEDAWLDEGINSYTEVNVAAALLGRDTSALSLPWLNLSDLGLQYAAYLSAPNSDPVTRHAWQFRNSASYGGITYGKSALLLKTLEGLLGKDTMNEAMRTWFQRTRFTHPTTEDFLNTIEEVATRHGRTTGKISNSRPLDACFDKKHGIGIDSLHCTQNIPWNTDSGFRPFFQQAVYGTATLDYSVDSIISTPVQWWNPDDPGKHLRDTVTIRRLGDFLLPVTLEVRFSDGTRIREQWAPTGDDNDRWKTFTYLRDARILSAEIDPDHNLPLDVDTFNNSRNEAPHRIPALKLTTLWLTATQLASQLAGWLI